VRHVEKANLLDFDLVGFLSCYVLDRRERKIRWSLAMSEKELADQTHLSDDEQDLQTDEEKSGKPVQSVSAPLKPSAVLPNDGSEKREDVEVGCVKGISGSPEPIDASSDVKDPKLVTWNGPDDPENPKLWSFKRKWAAVFIVSVFTLISPLSSSIVGAAYRQRSGNVIGRTEND
jgi:hypothetical protein